MTPKPKRLHLSFVTPDGSGMRTVGPAAQMRAQAAELLRHVRRVGRIVRMLNAAGRCWHLYTPSGKAGSMAETVTLYLTRR
ncbi:MAG: hypothetical protein IT464_12615 [Planctomycetes bacterium]|nr:hypothetical protein [Planctomycetota bacterium]